MRLFHIRCGMLTQDFRLHSGFFGAVARTPLEISPTQAERERKDLVKSGEGLENTRLFDRGKRFALVFGIPREFPWTWQYER